MIATQEVTSAEYEIVVRAMNDHFIPLTYVKEQGRNHYIAMMKKEFMELFISLSWVQFTICKAITPDVVAVKFTVNGVASATVGK